MHGLDRLRRWWQIRTGVAATPFEGDTPAWLFSLAVHLALLLFLALLTFRLPADFRLLLTTSPAEPAEEIVAQHFQFDVEPQEEIGARSLEGLQTASPEANLEALEPEIAVEVQPLPVVSNVLAPSFSDPVVQGPFLSEDVVIKGMGSIGTSGTAGAIDRITQEILRSLEQRPTLVVWLFDQSGSMQAQRDEVANRFDRIYQELGVIQRSGNEAFEQHDDQPLLTAVASFGASLDLLVSKPTDDVESIKAAVRSIRSDFENPQENVFSAVYNMADRFRHFRTRQPHRNVMLVVFTDEAGDDIDRLDAAVAICRRHAMPVYVVGVPAPFGRQAALVKYVDPDPAFDQSPQWVPVHHGPESLLPERIRLLSGRAGPEDEELLDSGFGPFGLTRLTYESGGMYFMVHPNRTVGRRVSPGETSVLASRLSRFFDPVVMRSYRPDYLSVRDHRRLVNENRARSALVEAAQLPWTRSLSDVRRVYPMVDQAEFARELSLAQRAAAELEPSLRILVDTLRQGERDRPRLEGPRWQAGYDLAMGRALAAQVRTEGFNAMLAVAKQGLRFENPQSDAWRLSPSGEQFANSRLERAAAEATGYLTRVVEEHPETPWALLAAQELRTPLGWQWDEAFHNIAARREQMQQNQNRPRQPRRQPPPQPAKPRRNPPAL